MKLIWSENLNTVAIVCFLLTGVACQAPGEKVQSERREARQEIAREEKKVQEAVKDAAKEVAAAKPVDRDDAKVEATEKIAAAKKGVADEKVEATKEVTEAEQKAGAGGSYVKE